MPAHPRREHKVLEALDPPPPDRFRVVGTLADGSLYADPDEWQDQGAADWRQIVMTARGDSVKIVRERWDVASRTWREVPY